MNMISVQDCREAIARNQGAMLAADPKFFRDIEARFDALKSKAAHPGDFRRLSADARAFANAHLSKDDWNSERDTPVADGIQAWIGLIDREIENRVVTGFGSSPNRSGWVNAETGTEIRVLAPGEKVATGHTRADVSVGEMVQGLIAGTSNPRIRAALSEGIDSAGGFSIPQVVLDAFIDRMRARTQFINAGARTVLLEGMKTRVLRISSDPIPAWRNENAAVAESDPTFDAVDFTPRSLAVMVRVSRELLADSANAADALEVALAGALAAEIDRVAFFGSGTAPEPRGLFSTTNINTFSMGTNGAVPTNWDPLLDALYELELDNAAPPTAAVMHPRTGRTFNKLKDTTGQPLVLPAAIADLPRLATSSFPINQTQGTSTDCSTIFLGDFSMAMMGIRQELRIERLTERYADNLQVAFLAHLRADIQFAQPAAFCRVVGVRP